MAPKYWLVKSEPEVFSFADLKMSRNRTTHWDGVRNYQARNFLREMEKGDRVLFYHSNCDIMGVVGVAEVTKEAYPDHSAWDPKSNYYDPDSTPENPRWFMVELTWQQDFKRKVTLSEIKAARPLQKMRLLQRGNRLSVMPVSKAEHDCICQMGMR